MEPNAEIQAHFTASANALTQFYRECQSSMDRAYESGRQEAYRDVLEWLLSSTPADQRYVHVGALLEYMHRTLPGFKMTGVALPESRKRTRDDFA